ncbi:hypothetical protein Tco_0861800 [Tanacetum coccineum]
MGSLKFISKGEPTQVDGMSIPDAMLNDEIKNSVAYETYLALSTGIKPLKKGRGKGEVLMSKKNATTAQEKKKSVPKNKGSITTKENIPSDPDEALQLEVDKEIAKHQKKKMMKGISIDIPKGLSEGPGSKQEVPNEPKGKSKGSSEGAEVHIKEEEQTDDEHYDEEVHDDEEIHDEDEKHDDVNIVDDEKEDEERNDAEKVDAEKSKEEKVDNEQAGDDQAKVDKAEDNQAGTLIFQAPLLDVLVSVIPIITTPTPSTTPPTTEIQATIVTVTDPSPTLLLRLSEHERKVEVLSKVDHSEVIKESVQANTPAFLAPCQSSSKAAESLSEYELNKILFDKMDRSRSYMTHDKHQELYDALLNSMFLDDTIASGEVNNHKVLRKRHHDEDQDLPTGKAPPKSSKTGKSITVKESVEEPVYEKPIRDDVVNDADQLQDDTWFNDLVNVEKDLLTFDEIMATPIDFTKFAMNHLKLEKITKEDLTNSEGDRCPYDLSKPLPLQGSPSHLRILIDFFFNNDLEYLKTRNSKRKYTTSITKTKVAKYELEFIEDMIPKLWSPVKVAYDKNAKLGILHWGPKRQLFYRSQINRFSKHEVYSTMKILSMIRVKADKRLGYGYLEEIVVRRDYGQEYSFKEGDFPRLHLNDIEYMLLLHVQNKHFNLPNDDIVDLVIVLCMFTRSLVIKKRVEDVQLRVESYQKKLNITKPQKEFPGISFKEAYTTSYDPKGVVYLNSRKQKRLMRADELYKFSDRTLKSVYKILHYRLLNLKLGYNKDIKEKMDRQGSESNRYYGETD